VVRLAAEAAASRLTASRRQIIQRHIEYPNALSQATPQAGIGHEHDGLLITPVSAADIPAISALHAKAFGPGRFARTAYRIRESTPDFTRHCRIARFEGSDERVMAAVRFTPVLIGEQTRGLLLGPVAVHPAHVRKRLGSRLITQAMAELTPDDADLVVLVGDEPFYAAFGFTAVPRGAITLPGPVAPDRLLAHELREGALHNVHGPVKADPAR